MVRMRHPPAESLQTSGLGGIIRLRRYAAGNLRPALLVQSRPTSPVMLVHLFETREEAETVEGVLDDNWRKAVAAV